MADYEENLATEETEEDLMGEDFIGKYGLMRLRHLRKSNKDLYIRLYMAGTLKEHLQEVDREATRQVDEIVKQMAAKEGTNEALKARDQMAWVGLMNNYQHCAEEIVLPDLVYG